MKKRLTEQDIEKMLGRTESIDPSFEKKVMFPAEKTIIRRRRLVPIIAAACLFVISVSVLPLAMHFGDNEGELGGSYAESLGSFISGVSYPSGVVSDDMDNTMGFPEYSDESREVAGESTSGDVEIESSQPDDMLSFEFPNDPAFFEGAGLPEGESPTDYLKDTPIDYLGSSIRLPVYSRETIGYDDALRLIKGASDDLRIDFSSPEYSAEALVAVSELNRFTISVSKYGDWSLEINDPLYLSVDISDSTEYLEAAVEKFILKNPALFEHTDYRITTVLKGNFVCVYLHNEDADDSYLTRLYSHKLLFELNNGLCIFKNATSIANGMQSVAKYRTKMYDEAMVGLLDDEYNEKYGYVFEKDEKFLVEGYDVRYISSPDHAVMCPYYVFVVRINPLDDSQIYKTIFVPAVVIE